MALFTMHSSVQRFTNIINYAASWSKDGDTHVQINQSSGESSLAARLTQRRHLSILNNPSSQS
jgi:hypothetical protein